MDIRDSFILFLNSCNLAKGIENLEEQIDKLNTFISKYNGEDENKGLFDINDSSDDIFDDLKQPDGADALDSGIKDLLDKYQSFLMAQTFIKAKEKQSTIGFQKGISWNYIVYGAPGTGKSHIVRNSINPKTKKEPHRITFHPDTDYASFVGCFKPNGEDNHFSFVPQVFIKAYVEAFKSLSETYELAAVDKSDSYVFLVIEELNRGNCAQIFGDMFQLLDRDKDGWSEYAIEPDEDLQIYLKKELENVNIQIPIREGKDHVTSDMIRNGERMILPFNLLIVATMNTSDQSLYPIDSAFKRRWEWVYVPNNPMDNKWIVQIDDRGYYWNAFLQQINDRIGKVTNSEDKKIGNWFVQPSSKDEKVIHQDTFVNKVLFYLWYDIFKDYANDCDNPFKDYIFTSFFIGFNQIDTGKVQSFMEGLGIPKIEGYNKLIEEDFVEKEFILQDDKKQQKGSKSPRVPMSVRFNGETISGRNPTEIFINTINQIINEVGVDAVLRIGSNFVTNDLNSFTGTKRDKAKEQSNGVYIYTNSSTPDKKEQLDMLGTAFGLDLKVRTNDEDTD